MYERNGVVVAGRTLALLLALHPVVVQSSVTVLVEDEFAGAAGAPPDIARFQWNGELAQNGLGQLTLNTKVVNQSWLRSSSGVTASSAQTVTVQMRAYAYADMLGIYGNAQPRGLRVGTDGNNVAEFYSVSRTVVGMRVRRDGVESSATYTLPSGVVDAMHDYGISVTPTSAVFVVDGVAAQTFVANIPAGALNVHVSTSDGGFGEVPVILDSVSLSCSGEPPLLSGFTPASGPVGTSVLVNGARLAGATAVRFGGVDAAFSVVSDFQLAATVPASARTGLIEVDNAFGTTVSVDNFRVNVVVTECTQAALDAALATQPGEILFACDGTITVTSAKAISSDTVLDANGHNVALSGNGQMRVLNVEAGARLTLRNLKIEKGHHYQYGGGLYNQGTVVATGCTFSENDVMGAFYGDSGYGGAIFNHESGSLILSNCTFCGNSVKGGTGDASYAIRGAGGPGGFGFGGAIYNYGGTVALVNCTFSGNQAIGGNGGAGGNGFDGYKYQMEDAWGTPYWVYVPGGPGGRGGDGGNGRGGSVCTSLGTVSMVNVTLARGSACGGNGGPAGWPGLFGDGDDGDGSAGDSSYGGNICNLAGSMTLKNTIVAYGGGSPGNNCYGVIGDNGNNISSDDSAWFSTADSANDMDPLLAANPVNNGGAVQTIALSGNSPAINAGVDEGAPTTDSRGAPRVGVVDVGAFEYQTPASAISYSWLIRYGLPLDGSADQADVDLDGMSMRDEWIAGTHPFDRSSCLRMAAIARVGATTTVSWQSVPGKKYLLYRCGDLGATPSFTLLADTIVGQGDTITYTDLTAVASGPFFYRVTVQQ